MSTITVILIWHLRITAPIQNQQIFSLMVELACLFVAHNVALKVPFNTFRPDANKVTSSRYNLYYVYASSVAC